MQIKDRARPSVADELLVRPDWATARERDRSKLWLDKNENQDPELVAVMSRTVRRVLEGEGNRFLNTYPESARLYSKLAAKVPCTPEQLVLAAGSDGVIRSVFETFVDPGDVVLHTSPTFAMYPVYARMYGAVGVPIDYSVRDGRPFLDVEMLLERIASLQPKLVCLPNPDSPTGTILSSGAILRISDACRRARAVLLIDEAYYLFHPETFAGLAADATHVIVARTFAKAWGLAGLRIGYAVAHEETARLLHKVRPMYEVNTVAVAVLEDALDLEDEVKASVGRLMAGLDTFGEAMESLQLPVIRTSGNFIHVAFGRYEPAIHKLLDPMVYYRRDGGEGCLKGFSRFSATTTSRFAPIVSKIQSAVKEGS